MNEKRAECGKKIGHGGETERREQIKYERPEEYEREADKSCCCIVIPAYEPPGTFVPYVKELLSCQEGPVIVVDDGSGEEFAPVFCALEKLPGCRVLTHECNRGKGAALKTAISWYNVHWGKEGMCRGIVTADCDGQYSLEDVLRVCRELTAWPDSFTSALIICAGNLKNIPTAPSSSI